MIHITDKASCCGCSACIQRCPKHCISLQEDHEGFLYPEVDGSLCIDCGLCEKVCPFLHPDEAIEPLQVLAVKNRNEEERMRSSSGGVFIELAKQVLAQNGVVFGAVYDGHWEVRFSYAETLERVRPMMGSKYLQARVESAYRDAELFLKQGREVLFTGSPCQISGLRKYLRKDYPNLLAVDFICHGVPSPGVWRKYLNETLAEPSARRAAAGKNSVLSSSLNVMPAVSGIEFRDKTLHGWKKFSFVVREKSASKADPNTVLLSDIHRDNPFMKGFLSDIYLRPSCYACKCKDGSGHSNLTIADFWGIDRLMPDFDDDKGVGLVLLNTRKGEEIFQALDMEVRTSTVDVVRTFNPAYCRSANQHPKREEFFRMYSEGVGVSEVVKRCLEVSFSVRLIHKVKRVIKNLLCIS